MSTVFICSAVSDAIVGAASSVVAFCSSSGLVSVLPQETSKRQEANNKRGFLYTFKDFIFFLIYLFVK
jgi:hypothetical protein